MKFSLPDSLLLLPSFYNQRYPRMVMGKQSQRPLGSLVPSGLGRFPPHQTGYPRLFFHPSPTTTRYVPPPVPAPSLVASHVGMGVNKVGEGRIHSLCPALELGPPSPPALGLGPTPPVPLVLRPLDSNQNYVTSFPESRLQMAGGENSQPS